MAKEIKVMALRIDNETGAPYIDEDVINPKDFLEYCYGTINCRTIELVEIEIEPKKWVDMYVDEEFLLKDHEGYYGYTPINEYTTIIGNYVIATANRAGNTCSVPEKLIPKVRKWIVNHSQIAMFGNNPLFEDNPLFDM